MKKILFYGFIISIAVFSVLLIAYGIMQFLLSTNLVTNEGIIAIRNTLFPLVYISFIVSLIFGFFHYKYSVK